MFLKSLQSILFFCPIFISLIRYPIIYPLEFSTDGLSLFLCYLIVPLLYEFPVNWSVDPEA